MAGKNGKWTLDMVSVDMIEVTPQLAESWLKKNRKNRPVSKIKVRQYAESMMKGEWNPNHQGIAFDTHGKLIDGQHRLQAVTLADVTIPMLVFEKCNPESFEDIDQGRRRNAADLFVLKSDDPGNANNVAGVATAMMLKEGDNSSVSLTRRESMVSDYAVENLDIIRFVLSKTGPMRKQFRCHHSGWLASFCNALKDADEHEADLLESALDRLNSQMWSGTYDPMKTLFTWIIARKSARNVTTSRVHYYMAGKRAVSAVLEGRDLSRIQVVTRVSAVKHKADK